MPDDLDLPKDFYEQKVAVIRPSHETIVLINDQNDREGTLLEEGDVLLISEKTKRDTSTGKDTLQVIAFSKDDFQRNFLRLNDNYFRPSHNTNNYGFRKSSNLGTSFSASFAEQFEAIKDFDEKAYKTHFEDIKNELDKSFHLALKASFKASLIAGKGLASFADVLEETKNQDLFVGCDDTISAILYDDQDVLTARQIFKDGGAKFIGEVITAQNTNYLDQLIEDWAERALERSMKADNQNSDILRANPTAIFNKHVNDAKEDLSYSMRIASGQVSLLESALKKKMAPVLAAHFAEATKDYVSYKFPVIGKRNKAKGLERFLKAVGIS